MAESPTPNGDQLDPTASGGGDCDGSLEALDAKLSHIAELIRDTGDSRNLHRKVLLFTEDHLVAEKYPDRDWSKTAAPASGRCRRPHEMRPHPRGSLSAGPSMKESGVRRDSRKASEAC